ncbi:catecholate siderophore receptor Fiu [Hylemonella sp. W303a]|uniref:catecholate siderophore receptor Fiu n=1 Tax=Hylemonella sp. W303a TaxID=3389873 RepID=UPI00396B3A7F
MAYIKSRKHGQSSSPAPLRTNLIGAAVLATLALPGGAQTAQSAGTLPSVTVKDTGTAEYKVETSANPKYTQPLLDTPKTIQVITKQTLEEQGAVTLTEALRNTPGITMQLGEGGNTSAGDTFQLRGFSLQQNTFVDGIRDLGAVTRDTFNLEQVEVVKGAAGAETGRGAASGYLNLISKQAHLGDDSSGTLTLGTAEKKRATVDLNRQVGDTSAIRINAMAQNSGVDGRDEVENKGTGLGLSLATGLGTPTRLYLYSQHIRQDNVPDGGIPTIGMPDYYRATATGTNAVTQAQANAMNAGRRVDTENFYGSKDDYEKVTADMVTFKVEHDLGQGTTVRNITRWGQNEMDREMTGVGAVTAPTATVNDSSTWTVARSHQKTDQVNTILANQTSLNTAFNALGLEHSLAVGVELMKEEQESYSFTAVGTTAAANLYNPNKNDTFSDFTKNVKTTGEMSTVSVYAFDNAKINEQFAINAGLRVDRYDLVTRTDAADGTKTKLDDEDTLRSWSVGGVYKPLPDGSVYVSYADSQTPPGGSNLVLSSTATNQANPNMDPQTTRTVELGTKWDLLDKRLNLATAVFRSVNDKQTTIDPITNATVQEGKTQVEGVELAAVGQITNFWQVTAGIAKTETKAIDQRSGTNGATVNETVRWSPDVTATLWTSYQISKATLGLGTRYVSEQKRVITKGTDLSTQNMPVIPSYWVSDLMAAYQVSSKLNVRLNIYNLFDEEYISTLNNNGSRMTLGAPRSATVTASYSF